MELKFVLLLVFLMTTRSQPSSNRIPKSANDLNVVLQEYAFRAFHFERTGILFDGTVPSYLTGINISALRLRSGSLYSKGFGSYKEFIIPPGVMDSPLHVERLVLVYHNLGNWSSYYYPLTGDHSYLAPVFGLLAYNGSNLSAYHLPLLGFNATGKPITVNFGSIKPLSEGRIMMCIWFDADGSKPRYYEMASANTCLLSTPGHCSIVDAPRVRHRESNRLLQLLLAAIVILPFLVCAILRAYTGREKAREARELTQRTNTRDQDVQLATAGNESARRRLRESGSPDDGAENRRNRLARHFEEGSSIRD